MIHIGNNFFKYAPILDILPGIDLPRGLYNVEIVSYSDNEYKSHSSYLLPPDKSNFLIKIDPETYLLDIKVYCHNSFPSSPLINYWYQIRVDDLILLNLACKLLRK